MKDLIAIGSPNTMLALLRPLSHADELIGQVGELLFYYPMQDDGVFSLCEDPAGECSWWSNAWLRAEASGLPHLVGPERLRFDYWRRQAIVTAVAGRPKKPAMR